MTPKFQTSEVTSKVIKKNINKGFPGFGGEDELNDEDDLPEQDFEGHEGKANIDDLDKEASK